MKSRSMGGVAGAAPAGVAGLDAGAPDEGAGGLDAGALGEGAGELDADALGAGMGAFDAGATGAGAEVAPADWETGFAGAVLAETFGGAMTTVGSTGASGSSSAVNSGRGVGASGASCRESAGLLAAGGTISRSSSGNGDSGRSIKGSSAAEGVGDSECAGDGDATVGVDGVGAAPETGRDGAGPAAFTAGLTGGALCVAEPDEAEEPVALADTAAVDEAAVDEAAVRFWAAAAAGVAVPADGGFDVAAVAGDVERSEVVGVDRAGDLVPDEFRGEGADAPAGGVAGSEAVGSGEADSGEADTSVAGTGVADNCGPADGAPDGAAAAGIEGAPVGAVVVLEEPGGVVFGEDVVLPAAAGLSDGASGSGSRS
ncbi:MAG TPA: hypothetical protein VHB68_19290 [Steroidobacteraceae bacterium]|nr:hypothetical protein [Steroidobacteraceae bacterium]